VTELASLIGQSISSWGQAVLERQVFDTDDPDQISAQIDSFCRHHLRCDVADGLFYTPSVGCVVGVVLADGRQAVMKGYQPRWTKTFLSAVSRVQRHLAQNGFTCPAPLAGPAPLGLGMASVETLLADPGPTPVRADLMPVSAAGLARVVALCRPQDATGLAPHPLDSPAGGLYPEPHSPLFDFEATAAGAEWIDELATIARSARDSLDRPAVVAHTDWSARNVRFGAEAIVAVYDWDSLALVTETTAVGQAAGTWSAFGVEEEPLAPSAEEVAAYVRCYEAARGQAFSPVERTAIGGAALWVLAYTARCEHALGADPTAVRRASGRLRAEGGRLLALSPLVEEVGALPGLPLRSPADLGEFRRG
jgi:hypothetical protein